MCRLGIEPSPYKPKDKGHKISRILGVLPKCFHTMIVFHNGVNLRQINPWSFIIWTFSLWTIDFQKTKRLTWPLNLTAVVQKRFDLII